MDNYQFESREIDDVVQALTFAKQSGKGCTLLVGAGCSFSAGIPLAAGIIERIKRDFPSYYERARKKAAMRAKDKGAEGDCSPSYSDCMAELTETTRRDLFAEYVDKAKINWAHICIAALVKAGYVDRILTTNFDSLILQACALLGEVPAVYDFASSGYIEAHNLPNKAVFHLHGQRNGFVLLNTEEAFEKHFELLSPLMDAVRSGRVWIVVGYSGETDPVFKHLVNVRRLDNELYWVGYRDNPPRQHIREKLLTKVNAYYVKNYSPDEFFEELTRQLRIFPPELVDRPFSYLESALDKLIPKDNLTRKTRQWIKSAIAQFEKPSSIVIITGGLAHPTPVDAHQLQIGEDLQALITTQEVQTVTRSAEYLDRQTRVYFLLGNMLFSQAATKLGEEAANLYEQAGKRYEIALSYRPESYEPLNNWGVALYQQAKTKPAGERWPLFCRAIEKFEAALVHNPQYYEALNNWGVALYGQAQIKEGAEAHQLFDQAIEKFDAALSIEKHLFQAHNNWGNALFHQARAMPAEEAYSHLSEAIKQYKKALGFEPGHLSVLNNWGRALLQQLRIKLGEEIQEELENEIISVSDTAGKVKRGGGYYLSACLNALVGNPFECLEKLKYAHRFEMLPIREYLMVDPSLESVRDSEAFQHFIKETFGE